MAVSILKTPDDIRAFIQEYIECLIMLGEGTPEWTAHEEIRDVVQQVYNKAVKIMREAVLQEA